MGSADLGDSGLKGIFKLEYQIAVDSGDNNAKSGQGASQGGELKQRNIYGGFQGKFGTVIGGKFDTTTKVVGDQIDMFHDLILGDIKYVLVGEDRLSNSFMYSTPKLMDAITINAEISSGEQSPNGGTATTNYDYRGMADTKIISAVYDTPTLYLALSHNENSSITTLATSTANPKGGGQDITRFVAQFKPMSDLVLGALYQTAKAHDSGTDNLVLSGTTGNPTGVASISPLLSAGPLTQGAEKQDGYVLSASYTIAGNNVIKAQYGDSKADTTASGDSAVEQKVWSLGYDYKLGKNAKVFTYYSKYKGSYTSVASVNDELKADTFALGYEQKF
jgi:hypothetical protein